MSIRHPVRVVSLTAAASLGATLLIGLIAGFDLGYEKAHLHISVRTAEALIGLMAAYLFYGRYRRRQRLDDFVLSAGFALLALVNLLFGTAPVVVREDPSPFSVWTTGAGRLIGTACLAVAALMAPRRLPLNRGQMLGAAGGLLALVTLVAVVGGLAASDLPQGVTVSGGDDNHPRLEAHWVIYGIEATLMCLFGFAALAFARRAERERDQLFGWLAVAFVLGAVARLNFLLFPSVHTVWFSTGDLFRLVFYLVVLGAALQEISSYWRSLRDLAALDERRRVARDIHDLLAQDLASINRNLAWLDDENRFVQRARAAADRALSETRRAIAALTERGERPLETLLGDLARQIGEREGVHVALDTDGDIELDVAQREALAMIATEAITNAARHGDASLVRVELRGGRRVTLRIEDAGRGFDPAVAPDGYGLVIMRERAEAVGGRLRVRSQPGQGAEIEVTL